jgi:transcription initiation factor IIE alpha subunit
MMDKMLKESVAALFCHVIKMDDKDIDVERPLFRRFMKQDFPDMTDEDACTLLDEVMEKEYNIDTQISIIANALHNEIYTKMSVLKQLNHIIVKSKLEDEDYDLFDKVKNAFFK